MIVDVPQLNVKLVVVEMVIGLAAVRVTVDDPRVRDLVRVPLDERLGAVML